MHSEFIISDMTSVLIAIHHVEHSAWLESKECVTPIAVVISIRTLALLPVSSLLMKWDTTLACIMTALLSMAVLTVRNDSYIVSTTGVVLLYNLVPRVPRSHS